MFVDTWFYSATISVYHVVLVQTHRAHDVVVTLKQSQ